MIAVTDSQMETSQSVERGLPDAEEEDVVEDNEDQN